MTFPPVDKPVYITAPTAEIREYVKPAQGNECYVDITKIQSFNTNCLDMGGYPSRAGTPVTSTVTTSGVAASMVSTTTTMPDYAGFYFIPINGSIPGEDMLRMAEADNKYNEQEIKRVV